MSAFFVLSTFHSDTFADDNCRHPANASLEKATVKWVYDGDTLLLKDNRKIRIIGIDTPETHHHKQQAEAYGARAREALREQLKKFNYQVTLHYGPARQDKYSRILAHVYLPDGSDISSNLLRQGYARTLAIPPNINFAECYKKAEISAQEKSLKIWRLKSHQIKLATNLTTKTKGFVRLKGKIKSISYNKKSVVMELQSNSKRPIQIKISKKNMRYFKSFDSDKLKDKQIIVSGMLKNKHGKRIIQINHSSQLKISPAKKIAPAIVPTIKWSL